MLSLNSVATFKYQVTEVQSHGALSMGNKHKSFYNLVRGQTINDSS